MILPTLMNTKTIIVAGACRWFVGWCLVIETIGAEKIYSVWLAGKRQKRERKEWGNRVALEAVSQHI